MAVCLHRQPRADHPRQPGDRRRSVPRPNRSRSRRHRRFSSSVVGDRVAAVAACDRTGPFPGRSLRSGRRWSQSLQTPSKPGLPNRWCPESRPQEVRELNPNRDRMGSMGCLAVAADRLSTLFRQAPGSVPMFRWSPIRWGPGPVATRRATPDLQRPRHRKPAPWEPAVLADPVSRQQPVFVTHGKNHHHRHRHEATFWTHPLSEIPRHPNSRHVRQVRGSLTAPKAFRTPRRQTPTVGHPRNHPQRLEGPAAEGGRGVSGPPPAAIWPFDRSTQFSLSHSRTMTYLPWERT